MNIKQSTLAAAVTAALAMGVAGQAAAGVYAGSLLDIQNLSINITGTTSNVINYKFDLANTAELNNQEDNTGNLSNTCGFGAGQTACSATSPVLAAEAANAPGGTVTRIDGAANNWDFFGPGSDTYANSDSQITTAQLVQFPTPTSTIQISEAEIAGTGTAEATTTVQSNTTFLWTFTVTGTGTFVLNFDADLDIYTEVDTLNLLDALAQANSAVTFTLSGGGQSVTWTPNGLLDQVFSICSGGLTCVENDDDEGLSKVITTGALGTINNPGSSGFSDNRSSSPDLGLSDFGITITGLGSAAGTTTYNLALNATNSVSVAQAVPEPGVLALMGIGLLGLGMSARRRKFA